MALKQQQKSDIKEVFGDRMSTGLLINLLTLFPKLLATVLEIIAVFKKHKKPDVQAFSECQTPRPKNRLTENGDWECIGGEWQWIEDLG